VPSRPLDIVRTHARGARAAAQRWLARIHSARPVSRVSTRPASWASPWSRPVRASPGPTPVTWLQRSLAGAVGALLLVAVFLIALPLLLIGAAVAVIVAVVLWFKYRRFVRDAQRRASSIFDVRGSAQSTDYSAEPAAGPQPFAGFPFRFLRKRQVPHSPAADNNDAIRQNVRVRARS
jgi:hypothetical protein